jgi:hypothetical protein
VIKQKQPSFMDALVHHIPLKSLKQRGTAAGLEVWSMSRHQQSSRKPLPSHILCY